LKRISAYGGDPSPLTALKPGEVFHAFPSFLPDGQHFIYFRAVSGRRAVYVGSLTLKPEDQDTNPLLETPFSPLYVPSANPRIGHLLYWQAGALMAQPFDNVRLKLAGDAVPVLHGEFLI